MRLCGRSVLAEAVLATLLASSPGLLPVEVESASLGPAFEGDHDQCILQVRLLSPPPPRLPDSNKLYKFHKNS